MSWIDNISDEDSFDMLDERRQICKSLIALHMSELKRWEGLKSKVETLIQMKSLKTQIAKTPKPTVAEADLLDHYKKLVDSTGKSEAIEVRTESSIHAEVKPLASTPAYAEVKTPASTPAYAEVKTPISTPATQSLESPKSPESPLSPEPTKSPESTKSTELTKSPESTKSIEIVKLAEPAVITEPSKPSELTVEPSSPLVEPILKDAEIAAKESAPGDEAKLEVKSLDLKTAEKTDTPAVEPDERLSISTDEPTNLGSLGSKPKMRGSTTRAHPTLKKDPLVFTPTVVAPSQAEMEEMEKKRAIDDAGKKSDLVDSQAKGKKVQPMGFNPLLGMKAATGPALKYEKCNDCPCDDFSPDTFKKGKCTNCFHIHPVCKDATSAPPASPSAAGLTASPSSLSIREEEEQPPPTTPFSPSKNIESKSETRPSEIAKTETPRSPVSDEALKLPPASESGPVSPNAKKMIGAKGFNLGLTPTDVSPEPVMKCKDCGCDDFSPDSFKKTKCANCFHVHTGAPPPPKTGGPKMEEVAPVDAVPKCKDCGCGNFKPDPFKKSKCSNCFHNHV